MSAIALNRHNAPHGIRHRIRHVRRARAHVGVQYAWLPRLCTHAHNSNSRIKLKPCECNYRRGDPPMFRPNSETGGHALHFYPIRSTTLPPQWQSSDAEARPVTAGQFVEAVERLSTCCRDVIESAACSGDEVLDLTCPSRRLKPTDSLVHKLSSASLLHQLSSTCTITNALLYLLH